MAGHDNDEREPITKPRGCDSPVSLSFATFGGKHGTRFVPLSTPSKKNGRKRKRSSAWWSFGAFQLVMKMQINSAQPGLAWLGLAWHGMAKSANRKMVHVGQEPRRKSEKARKREREPKREGEREERKREKKKESQTDIVSVVYAFSTYHLTILETQ